MDRQRRHGGRGGRRHAGILYGVDEGARHARAVEYSEPAAAGGE
jgi:hypothetical protein